MAERKVLEVAWFRPKVIHVAELLLDCGHTERIESSRNRMALPETKFCLACDARGEPAEHRVATEIFEGRAMFFRDRVVDDMYVEKEVVSEREATDGT